MKTDNRFGYNTNRRRNILEVYIVLKAVVHDIKLWKIEVVTSYFNENIEVEKTHNNAI